MSLESHEPHPMRQLRGLFGATVERAFLQKLGVYEPGVTDYLADVLTDFAHVNHLHKVKTWAGKPLEEVADMLLEADPKLSVGGLNREREIHRHIGDFTLFWAGVYPEALPQLQSQGKKDHLIDYVTQGKKSYARAAQCDTNDNRPPAHVLQKLSEEFELCLFGLNLVRKEIDGLARSA